MLEIYFFVGGFFIEDASFIEDGVALGGANGGRCARAFLYAGSAIDIKTDGHHPRRRSNSYYFYIRSLINSFHCDCLV